MRLSKQYKEYVMNKYHSIATGKHIEKIPLLIMLIILLLSCEQRQSSKSVQDTTKISVSKNTDIISIGTQTTGSHEEYIDSRYVYTDSDSKQLTIENSLPKGGIKYSAPNNQEYIYVVTWTRIVNETDSPFELAIEFSDDFYETPSSPVRYFSLFIPSDSLANDKLPLFNYGLDVEKFLDTNVQNQAEFRKSINFDDSDGFYVVTLFNEGVSGTVRTGLSIKNQNLLYRVNDKEILSGAINGRQFKLQK